MYVRNPITHVINKWADTEINHKRLESGKYGVELYTGEVQQSDVNGLLYEKEFCPMKTDKEKLQERQKQFETEFFLTSLGYIRRKVTMATGDIKDFLTDLLPSIKGGIEVGMPPTIITYDKPDFTKDITDLSIYQKPKVATMDFVKECFAQLSNDFLPAKEEMEELSLD